MYVQTITTIKIKLTLQLQKEKKEKSLWSTHIRITIYTLHTTNLQYATYRKKRL